MLDYRAKAQKKEEDMNLNVMIWLDTALLRWIATQLKEYWVVDTSRGAAAGQRCYRWYNLWRLYFWGLNVWLNRFYQTFLRIRNNRKLNNINIEQDLYFFTFAWKMNTEYKFWKKTRSISEIVNSILSAYKKNSMRFNIQVKKQSLIDFNNRFWREIPFLFEFIMKIMWNSRYRRHYWSNEIDYLVYKTQR